MKFIIPSIPPSYNQYAGRNNSWDYRNTKKEWTDLVFYCCKPKPPKPLSNATITLTYYFESKRRHDPDNYAGKMILDGLTRAGIITDDSFDCIELVLKGNYDKNNPRTEIEIKEN